MRNLACIIAVCSLICLPSCVQDEAVDHRPVPKSSSRPSPTSEPAADPTPRTSTTARTEPMSDEAMPKTDEEWRKILTAEQYRILREHGTERAFTGKFWDNKKAGDYVCAGCGEHLFDSETKFESGTGWPSFYKPATEESVETTVDKSLGMVRTEVHCKRCGGHLGHVFDDGPEPTGQRYCINSASLDFREKK